MAAADWLFVVDVTVDPSIEEAWNDWYDRAHLPEIADCPGFLSGNRYMCEDAGGRRYLTVYEIEGPQTLETQEFASRRGWGPFAPQVQARTGLYHRRATPPPPEALAAAPR